MLLHADTDCCNISALQYSGITQYYHAGNFRVSGIEKKRRDQNNESEKSRPTASYVDDEVE